MLRPYMIALFNESTADDVEMEFNGSISMVHVTVEGNHEDIKRVDLL